MIDDYWKIKGISKLHRIQNPLVYLCRIELLFRFISWPLVYSCSFKQIFTKESLIVWYINFSLYFHVGYFNMHITYVYDDNTILHKKCLLFLFQKLTIIVSLRSILRRSPYKYYCCQEKETHFPWVKCQYIGKTSILVPRAHVTVGKRVCRP